MSDSNSKNKKNQNLNTDDETRTSIPGSSCEKLESHHPKKIGQYLIKRIIASGGMGTVFEALQENPKRPVAIKVIKSNLTEKEKAVVKFLDDAKYNSSEWNKSR